MKKTSIIMVFCLLAVVALVLTAGCTCTGGAPPSEQKSISIGYVLWDSEIASTNVIKQVFEQAGYDVTITAVDTAPLFEGLAKGDIDCSVSGWLPVTQNVYWEKYGDRIDLVRKNLEGGAFIGLVVPSYVTVDSVEDLNDPVVREKFGGKVYGIDPGSGTMHTAEKLIEAYDLDYELVPSSTAGMVSALKRGIDRNEWVVVTGWTPHWKFARWDLKFLDEPRDVFGKNEYIATFARQGLAEDDPEAYGILERFHWTAEDMNSVMLDIEEGMTPEDAAQKWIDAHPEEVKAWIGIAA
ncbi:glycine betaine ABC transporter substrate-binding protein [Methanofollis aquaemaris]|nr:glycine betaine ABC transporter substrate-binding protein [Methanofollis aquaemaris]